MEHAPQKPFTVHILTLFPEVFPGVLEASITGRGLKEKLWTLEVTNIRTFATDKHKTVDDTPYGGGAGMVMRADVVGEAIEFAKKSLPEAPVVYLTPTGGVFNQARADDFAMGAGIILLCGHYEGIDQRVIDTLVDVELSVGDFVLTGGEVAVFPVVDAIIRQLKGVLGNNETLAEESFSPALEGLLEYPHYTRPEVWRKKEVPAVLKSGHHGNIAKWRRQQAQKRTAQKRPDLLEKKGS